MVGSARRLHDGASLGIECKGIHIMVPMRRELVQMVEEQLVTALGRHMSHAMQNEWLGFVRKET